MRALKIAVLASLSMAISMTGCSSEQPAKAAPSDAISFDASPASQTELGVFRWEATTEQGHVVTRGFGSDGSLAADLDARIFVDDARARHVQLRFEHAGREATIELETTTADGDPAVWVQSTVANDDPLRRGLDLLMADLRAASGHVSLGAASFGALKPANGELVTKGCEILHSCSFTNQTLLCGKTAVGLLSCNPLDLVETGGKKGAEEATSVFGKLFKLGKKAAEIADAVPDCIDGVTNLPSKCFGGSWDSEHEVFFGQGINEGCAKLDDKNSCDDGACHASARCSSNSDCCGGNECRNGTCQEAVAPCGTSGLACAGDGACCSGHCDGMDTTGYIKRGTCR